jgi:hypothetical protein
MKKNFEIDDNNIIKLHKDCKFCAKIKVCKFHSKMSDLCKSNEFFSMNEYLEWNNSLEAFELHARCRYYELNFKIDDDDNVDLNVDRVIIDQIISREFWNLKNNDKNANSYSTDIKNDTVTVNYSNTTDKQIFKISDFLQKYKFAK